jgi:hypothetical protein
MLVSKKKPSWSGLLLIFAASLCSAGSRCPDPRQRQASIGGDTIRGGVILHKKAVQFSQVRIYFSSGKTAWVGITDRNGNFTSTELPPGKYRLDIERWGSFTVQLDPNFHKATGNKTPLWSLFLNDHACVMTAMSW